MDEVKANTPGQPDIVTEATDSDASASLSTPLPGGISPGASPATPDSTVATPLPDETSPVPTPSTPDSTGASPTIEPAAQELPVIQVEPTPEPTPALPQEPPPTPETPTSQAVETPPPPSLDGTLRAKGRIDFDATSPIPTPTPTPTPTAPPVPEIQPIQPEPQVVERIVEKIVEVEKPVEKIVEKIVYRDPEPTVCPPPTAEEIEAIHKDFLIKLSHEGTARKHELMTQKLDAIMALLDTHEHINHKDVMNALDCSSTTATRLLTELRHEGKLHLNGSSPHTFTYTKHPKQA